MNNNKDIEPTSSMVQIRELLADREAARDDIKDMRQMLKFLIDRCHQLENAYNDRETRFREELKLKDEEHKREMMLAMVQRVVGSILGLSILLSQAEVSELESRIEALSGIKHELNFRLHQLEGGAKGDDGIATTTSSSPICGCCLERPASTVVLPCRHLVLCYHCSRQLSLCPVCRSIVNERLDVFI